MSWFGGCSPCTPAVETRPEQVVELQAVGNAPLVVETPPEPEKPLEEPQKPEEPVVEEPPEPEKPLEEPQKPEEPVVEEPPAKKPKPMVLALGSVVPDPENETRGEYLERARKKFKCSRGKIVDKAKGVEGLWELWPAAEDEAAPLVPTTPKVKGKAEPKAKAEPKGEPAGVRRGRPGSNAELKDRILDGGEIQTEDEYAKIPDLIKLANRQHSRMVQAGKLREAEDATAEITRLYEESDRWADANHTSRIRRVEQQHLQNDVLFRTGVQMIQKAHRQDGQLLEAELRLNRRSETS